MTNLVDDNALRALITKSVLDAMTPATREALIADAIKQILAVDVMELERKSIYGRTNEETQQLTAAKSLKQAFWVIAGQVMRETLETTENKARLAEACQQVIDRTINDKFVEVAKAAFEEAVSKAFRNW